MQAKVARPTPYPDTQDRLFGSELRAQNPLRTQNLRDRDLQGKAYNIVSKTKIVDWPSSGEDRSRAHDYAFIAHPSQWSLEDHRSSQGAVPRGDRSTGVVLV